MLVRSSSCMRVHVAHNARTWYGSAGFCLLPAPVLLYTLPLRCHIAMRAPTGVSAQSRAQQQTHAWVLSSGTHAVRARQHARRTCKRVLVGACWRRRRSVHQHAIRQRIGRRRAAAGARCAWRCLQHCTVLSDGLQQSVQVPLKLVCQLLLLLLLLLGGAVTAAAACVCAAWRRVVKPRCCSHAVGFCLVINSEQPEAPQALVAHLGPAAAAVADGHCSDMLSCAAGCCMSACSRD